MITALQTILLYIRYLLIEEKIERPFIQHGAQVGLCILTCNIQTCSYTKDSIAVQILFYDILFLDY